MAASTPMNANRVKAMTLVMTSTGGKPVALKGPRFAASKAMKPSVPMRNSGTTFRIVRTRASAPPVATPLVFT